MSGHGVEAEPAVQTALHRAAPECKVLATLTFVLAVALTPSDVVWPYLLDAALLAGVAVWARVEPRRLALRLLVEIPFILFIVVLPFVTAGPQVNVLGVDLAREGLWTAWGIAAKATLAVLATGVLSATTPAPAIIGGLQRLHVPRALTTVAAFAIRYLQVVLDELGRMHRARLARGDDARWLWQARATARSAGALVVRCFERGQRVHLAMLARGFDGHMPDLIAGARATALAWPVALAAPLLAAAAAAWAAWGTA